MAVPDAVSDTAVQVGCAALRHALQVDAHEAWTATLNRQGSACNPRHLMAWAQHHNVIPSVYRALAAVDHPDAMPLRNALAPHAQTVAAAGLLQAQALTDILHALDRHNIDVIPLKGVHLDVRAYGGPGKRKDGDHDWLIRREQLTDAVAVLRELGYAPTDPSRPVETWQDTVPIHHGPPLVRQEGPMPSWIEVHWHTAPVTEGLCLHDPAQRTATVWRRSHPATLRGAPIREMDPADEVAYLALHAIRHMAQHTRGLSLRFSMLEDLYRRIQSLPNLSGRTLQTRMQALGQVDVQGPLHYVWTALLDAPKDALWPNGASPEASWPRQGWERMLLPEAFLRSAPHPDGPSRQRWHREKAWGLLLHALLLPRWRDRAALIAQDLLHPLLRVNEKDRAVAPALPDALLLPVRWARLGWRTICG